MLTVIIPAHLEEKRIGEPLRKLQAYLQGKKIQHRIIVVTDADDRTAQVVRNAEPKATVIVSKTVQGKGAAIARGLSEAEGIVLICDADGATPPEFIPKALNRLKKADAVMGTRRLEQRPWYRRIVSQIFHALTTGLFGLPFSDTQCGFKLFNAKAVAVIQKTTSAGLQWDVEALYRLRKAGLRLVELPVAWSSVPGGPVESKRVRNVLGLLWDTLWLRVRL